MSGPAPAASGAAAAGPATLRAQAEAHAARRDWPAAIAAFESLLAQRPADPDLLLQLSYIETLAGGYRRARSFALRAAALQPRDPAVVAELIARLRTFNEGPAIQACIESLPPLAQLPIPLLLQFAAQLSYLNDQGAAMRFLDEARRGDPDYPATLLARAQVLIYLGRFDDARADLQRCLRRAPGIARAWWLLTRLPGLSRESALATPIRALLDRGGQKADDTALLGYALHAVLDAYGDPAGAWDALEVACRAKRASLQYDSADSFRLIDALVTWRRDPQPIPEASSMPAGSSQSVTAASGVSSTTAVPVFIIGMHRSGTTLLEHLVDGHPDVHGIGELYDFPTQMRQATDRHCRGVLDSEIVARAGDVDFATVGRAYLDGVAWRMGGERFFTDKLPSNFLNAGFICEALPQARLLHMVREPVETCFSNLREMFSEANPYSYDQAELAAYYLQYRRLMAHWHARYPGRILDVDYARLTANPEQVLREACAFIGLPFDSAMLDAAPRARGIATASAGQVRGGVVAREVPKWQPYASQLRPLIDALQAGGALGN